MNDSIASIKIKTGMTLIAALLGTATLTVGSASAAVLAGWYDFGASGNADHETSAAAAAADATLLGVGAEMYGGDGDRGAWSSTDGTYGPSESTGESGGNGGFTIRNSTGDTEVFFTITNNGGLALTLDTFVFDYLPLIGGGGNVTATDRLSLFYDSGDLSDADDTLIGFIDDIDDDAVTTTFLSSDYLDASFSLGLALSDQTLGVGQSATFRLLAEDLNDLAGESGGVSVAVDNFAILGTAVPEPGSLALLGLGGLLLIARRRRG